MGKNVQQIKHRCHTSLSSWLTATSSLAVGAELFVDYGPAYDEMDSDRVRHRTRSR